MEYPSFLLELLLEFCFNFLSNNRNNQKITKHNKKQKKKHDKVLMLAKIKLNSIETLVSEALIDMEISHDEFDVIMKEKKIREDEIKCEECKWKKMRLNSVNSRT